MAWRAWLPDKAPPAWQSALLGVTLAAAATALRFALGAALGRDLPFITYFPVLILAAALGGAVGGVSCLVVALAAVAILLLPREASAAWALGSFLVSGALIVLVAAALADSVRELRRSRAKFAEAQSQLQTVVGELAHRSRNALFVIMSIVSQTARDAPSAAAAGETINARLSAMMRAQEVVVQADGGSAALHSLLERALEPFGPDRFQVAPSPDVEITADVAVGLGLLFYELATNALKYGALSAPEGRVRISWRPDEGLTRLTWREVGGPHAAEPNRKGFGSRLLDVALVPQGGRAERRFEPEGVVCELFIPDLRDAPRAAHPPGTLFVQQAAAAMSAEAE